MSQAGLLPQPRIMSLPDPNKRLLREVLSLDTA